MGQADLSGLSDNDTMTSVSDAILTGVIEVEQGNKPDLETSN